MRHSRTFVSAAALLALAGPLAAQDLPIVLHRGPALGGPRLVGMAGAYQGVGDDANTILANPAGMFSIPRSLDGEIALGLRSWQPLFMGVAFHMGPHFSVGIFGAGAEPGRELVAEEPEEPVPPSIEQALFSGPAGREWASGASLAFRPGRRFAVGATGAFHQLNLRPDEPGRTDSAFGYTLGIFYRPDQIQGARAGLVYRGRRTWKPNPAGVPDPVEVRTPESWGAGISWRYDAAGARTLFTLQPELVRYSEIRLRNGRRGNDDFDLAAGFETSLPIMRRRCFSGCGAMIQVRGGIINRAAGPATVPVGRRTSWTAGLAYAPHRALPIGKFRFEASYRHDTRTLGFGVGVRYPESYRADLENIK